MELTKKERLILHNQYEILMHLDPQEKERYKINQKIVYSGFKYDYNELIDFLDEETPIQVSEFVWDVLQMYRTLSDSYGELSPEEKQQIDERDITYDGFDGNEEGKYYTYANFVLKDLGRYEEIYNGGKGRLNSHSNRVSKYKKMVSIWKEVSENEYSYLTLEHIKYITSF